MPEMRIASVRMNFFEDENGHAGYGVSVEWVHTANGASKVLGMCGGGNVDPVIMLGDCSTDYKALKTTRTFRFENADDALDTYEEFQEQIRKQERRVGSDTHSDRDHQLRDMPKALQD